MKLIDFHVHVYPAAIARKATENICAFYDLVSDNEGTPEEKLALDAAAGIRQSLLLPVAMSPKNAAFVNEFVLELARKDPAFVAFGTVHPDEPDLPARAETLHMAGHIGIKLHPDMQQVNIDDERLLPMYDHMQGRMPLYLHAGDPRHPYSHPERIKRIMELFPRLVVVGAHLGGWSMQDLSTPLLSPKENYLIDTASAMSFMPMEKAVKIIRAYGADRVFFGTDYPVGNVKLERETFDRLPLTDDEKEKIGFRNAERFFAACKNQTF